MEHFVIQIAMNVGKSFGANAKINEIQEHHFFVRIKIRPLYLLRLQKLKQVQQKS